MTHKPASPDRPIRYIPPRVLTMAREQREWARKAGPVIRVQATKCECGGWMRPGVDHACQHVNIWRHLVQHVTGQPVRCSCGWVTAVPVDPARVERIAVAHIVGGRMTGCLPDDLAEKHAEGMARAARE